MNERPGLRIAQEALASSVPVIPSGAVTPEVAAATALAAHQEQRYVELVRASIGIIFPGGPAAYIARMWLRLRDPAALLASREALITATGGTIAETLRIIATRLEGERPAGRAHPMNAPTFRVREDGAVVGDEHHHALTQLQILLDNGKLVPCAPESRCGPTCGKSAGFAIAADPRRTPMCVIHAVLLVEIAEATNGR